MRNPCSSPGCLLVGAFMISGCAPSAAPAPAAPGAPQAAASAAQVPLILAANDGERRIWRHVGVPFYLKIDRRNGGSPDLVVGMEDIPPGVAIPVHRHLAADEMIFIHHGNGIATVGERRGTITAGSMVYIPRDSRVTLQNTGAEPLSIVFVFSRPGFEELMRDASVADGEPVRPLGPDELAAIFAKHRVHTVYDP